MSAATLVTVGSIGIACLACGWPARPSAREAAVGIDSLNARIVQAYRNHDPQAYAALYSDTAGFEWPPFNTGRGPKAPAAMGRRKLGPLQDIGLPPTVSNPPGAAHPAAGVWPV